ncbi:MAG: RNA polymerase factor sigma-54 [Rhodocyclaceae bacterium]|nr:RNA polymerase factor sigma-54 [Rhodocyclaceae bacterium]
MKPQLSLKLTQHLALTPQLQQSIRLLQLSTLELNQEIEQALQDNPLLERVDAETPAYAGGAEDALAHAEASAEDAQPQESLLAAEWSIDAGEWQAVAQGGVRDPNDEDVEAGEIAPAHVTLRDHLTEQLALSQLSDAEKARVAFLIEALEEDGYLSASLEELAEVMPAEIAGAPEEKLENLAIALKHLQSFDPPGVGARDARECLLLQLDNLPPSDTQRLARAIVAEHLETLAARDYSALKKAIGCDEDALRAAMQLIRTLNPRPGAPYAFIEPRYVTPDVIVRKVQGRWTAFLNQEAVPKLRINRLYADLIRQNRANGGGNLVGQLQEAKWLIKNIEQRAQTILRVAQAIVDRQRAFFDHGEVAMRPLTLREIAETVGLHESTVSRVTNQKYLASPRGIFELKYFFGSHVATESGGAASSTAIRALIKQLIAAEDGQKPLSDAKIAEILAAQGITVARRTVAKYRESLGIPAVAQRKTL